MFDKKYDFASIEKQMQEIWQKNDVYKFDINNENEIYSIDTPPPTVSGSLHIGHIFSYTQAEMIARFRRMQGYNVFYPFGFDDNGLPTERLVEKEEKIVAKNFGRREFAQKCLATTTKYESEFKDLWNSLGFSCDWSLQYETISEDVQKISQASFIDLVNKGKAYAKQSPVLWCTECHTSIAQAELDTAELDSSFNYVNFMYGDAPIVVATTRPELLYGVVCLFVNPSDDRYKQYLSKNVRVPLYNYEVPVLADEKVDIEKGTGVVMCATYGDTTDVQWCEEYSLPYRKVILQDGVVDEDVPYIGKMKVKAARKKIIELLEEQGLLVKSEQMSHMVAVHERCGKEVEIIPSKQWYIDVLSAKDRLLKAADEITWYPEYMKNRYAAWVENLKWDWCISRQRYFGVPFPVWYCENCGKTYVADIEKLPVNPIEESPDGSCACGCDKFIPETAVFDTWATSSLTPQINAKYGLKGDISEKLLPMSMRTQAHEIIRTWAFYTIVKSLYHTGRLPWKHIMICGFVLAKKGEKISKSKSNSQLSPPQLIAQQSADVLRYWAANAKLGTDTYFAPDELTIAKRFITKFWNAQKFAISHLTDYEPDYVPNLLPVDKWIIERTNKAIKEAAALLYNYEIGSARHVLDDLFWKDICDNYLEIVKDRLYKPEVHGLEQRKSAQYALYYAILNITKAYGAYVPHITEFMYQKFFKRYEKSESIHVLTWVKPERIDDEIIEFGEKLKEAVSNMRKYKSENNLSMRAEMETFEISGCGAFVNMFKATEKDLIACSNAKEVVFIV